MHFSTKTNSIFDLSFPQFAFCIVVAFCLLYCCFCFIFFLCFLLSFLVCLTNSMNGRATSHTKLLYRCHFIFIFARKMSRVMVIFFFFFALLSVYFYERMISLQLFIISILIGWAVEINRPCDVVSTFRLELIGRHYVNGYNMNTNLCIDKDKDIDMNGVIVFMYTFLVEFRCFFFNILILIWIDSIIQSIERFDNSLSCIQ